LPNCGSVLVESHAALAAVACPAGSGGGPKRWASGDAVQTNDIDAPPEARGHPYLDGDGIALPESRMVRVVLQFADRLFHAGAQLRVHLRRIGENVRHGSDRHARAQCNVPDSGYHGFMMA
jgi:hypothetical protein